MIKHPMNIMMTWTPDAVAALENDGVCLIHVNGKVYKVEELKNPTEQFLCQSYFDSNNKLQGCTCGKCK